MKLHAGQDRLSRRQLLAASTETAAEVALMPKRSEMSRRFDVRLRTVCQQIVKSASYLDDKHYRPLILSCARVTLLI